VHELVDLVRQRIFQIALGYEDADDADTLRTDPALKAACERLPISGVDLASQPTLSRLENHVSRTQLMRMAYALGDAFIAAFPTPPRQLLLDLDDTDDPVHGAQQLALFNAHCGEYAYQPLHIYDGLSGRLVTTVLRPGLSGQRHRHRQDPTTRGGTTAGGLAPGRYPGARRQPLQHTGGA
jgi:hypothetical protein